MNQKRHVLIFSTAYYPFVGGAEVSVKEITDRLSGDFEFDLITAQMHKDLPSVEKIGSVTVYRVGFGKATLDKILLPFLGAIKVWKLQKNKDYFCFWAVMVTFASGAGYVYNIFRKIRKQKKVPIILNLQEGDSERHLNYRWAGLIDLSWRLALWQTDMVTALSTFLLHRAKSKRYVGKSVLIPNGVNIPLFAQDVSEQTKNDLKNKLGKKPGDIFLVTTSRLVHKNANDDVISALTYLPDNVHFVVIGTGELLSKLQKQARDLGVANRVQFLGFVSNMDLPKYLSVCDIFIRPSRSEGFGISFIEAMAAGLPVIATPVGGIPDFLDDKQTGVFCSPDNPKSISEAVKLLIENQSLREKITGQAKARVIQRYNWDFLSQEMKTKVFEKLL